MSELSSLVRDRGLTVFAAEDTRVELRTIPTHTGTHIYGVARASFGGFLRVSGVIDADHTVGIPCWVAGESTVSLSGIALPADTDVKFIVDTQGLPEVNLQLEISNEAEPEDVTDFSLVTRLCERGVPYRPEVPA